MGYAAQGFHYAPPLSARTAPLFMRAAEEGNVLAESAGEDEQDPFSALAEALAPKGSLAT